MMKKLLILIGCILTFFGGRFQAEALPELFDWAYLIDGTTYEQVLGDSMPVEGTLNAAGLGTLSWETNMAGTHTFIAFFDHQFDPATNTYYNEFGSAMGTPATGQSWEIDEPGWVFGDIYGNTLAGSLDTTNAVPWDSPDDVSWALGWDFALSDGDTVVISLLLSDITPNSGFYLSHTDPESSETIYFSSSLSVSTPAVPIPEPATFLLMTAGLVALSGYGCKKSSGRRS
jgi:hypothetical protein